jgi:pyruvate dehydrogenase E2 component (dihydrolipoamide acetyltransferase)
MPIQITMPALSPTMEEGALAKWLKKEGDSIKAGDVIAEIETDKATMEVEAVEEGILGKILVQEGAQGVKVNTPIALLLEEGEDQSALDAPAGAPAPKADAKPEASLETPAAPAPRDEGLGGQQAKTPHPEEGASAPVSKGEAPARSGGDRIKASPLARRMAADAGVDLSAVQGSGPGGRIVKADIEGAGKGAAAAKAPAAASEGGPLAKYGITADRYELKPADGIQKIVAKRLTDSFRDIPHFPLTMDLEIDALLALRKQINGAAAEGIKVSVNDLLIKAAGLSLRRVPAANASWTDDGMIAWHKHADVSVAVAIEGGLITPIVRDADSKGLAAISAEMKDLAARARDRKLKPEEFQGGTFSLSNLGMFGVKSFASIINPPQGMILSAGAGEERPVVKNGALAKANVMTVTLTCDHRVVDGATGAKWLSIFKAYVEAPLTMLL